MLRRRNTPEPVARPQNCLNCGVAVPPESVYCGQCGQENEVSPVSFAALMSEVWEEFVKVDAKLLRTLAMLVGRPGYLSTEFVRGRRTAYLSPFRMYIGVSALFFFVFGIMVPFDRINDWDTKADAIEQRIETQVQKKKARDRKPHKPTDTRRESHPKNEALINGWKKFRQQPIMMLGYSIPMNALPETVSEYRDQQNDLPRPQRDSPALHYAKERLIHFKNEPADTIKSLFSTALPLMLLIQLPLASIWLRLLYFRQKRLYVEHLVFLLHTHTLYLLLLGLVLAPEAVMRSMGAHWALFDRPLLWGILAGGILWHNLIAIRRFYGQGWGKTLIKSWFFGQGYWALLGITIIISLSAAILWTMLVPG